MISIRATKCTPTSNAANVCHRCGIDHQPRSSITGERANYCSACRPEAVRLGWCEPTERQAQAAASQLQAA